VLTERQRKAEERSMLVGKSELTEALEDALRAVQGGRRVVVMDDGRFVCARAEAAETTEMAM
jgi:cell division protein FtsI/penicillin-binding protein 2